MTQIQTAFDTAFALLKRYTPNWRDEVKDIAPLEDYEVPFIDEWDSDDDEAKAEMEGFISSGSKAHVFEHPWSYEHVVKVPVDDPYYRESFDMRIDPNTIETLQFLEDLGYPIATEMPMGSGASVHTIQPKMRHVFGRPHHEGDRATADRALAHLMADRHNANFAVDSAGKSRMIDLEAISPSGDFWPNTGAEGFQTEYLDPLKIQHPVSRILDYFDDEKYWNNMRFRRWLRTMEELEPFSDNPNTLTVDGKPHWLEGYD